ncbi:MAG: hypothetical protein JSR38_04475 [Proteobacteria bacterium]|nr:hypothetical protein [Pseudomonadota bacterium]
MPKLEPLAPRALRATKVHAIYGVTKTLLRSKEREGLLHPTRIGPRCTLYDVAELDAVFLAKDTPPRVTADGEATR